MVALAQVVVVQVDQGLDGLLHGGHLQEGHLVISSETKAQRQRPRAVGKAGTAHSEAPAPERRTSTNKKDQDYFKGTAGDKRACLLKKLERLHSAPRVSKQGPQVLLRDRRAGETGAQQRQVVSHQTRHFSDHTLDKAQL